MKKTNYMKYAQYMRSIIESKYPDFSIVWAGENNFILIKYGIETRIKYE